jgi:hypothetical protein
VTNKNTYIQSLKSKLEQLDLELQHQEALAKSKSGEAHAAYLKQKKRLHAKRDLMNKELQSLSEASENAWEDLKGGVENAWQELKTAAEEARTNFS